MKPVVQKSYPIKKKDFIQAGTASIGVKNLLKSIGIDPQIIRRVAVCGYEGEMNAVMHGGDGLLSVEISDSEVIVNISDNGPGIEDIDMAMQKGFSTAAKEYREMGFGAGMGLPNMEKNSDQIEITSERHKETKVRMTFFLTNKKGEKI